MTSREDRPPLFHRELKAFAGWFFAIYHDIRVSGAEHLPASGAAIVAANHPTYLDPAFLMVGLRRPIRFMAWEKPFRIPLLGAMMRAYGAIDGGHRAWMGVHTSFTPVGVPASVIMTMSTSR